VSGAMNGSLKVFDLNEGKLARSLRGHQTMVTSIHYHPYGEFVVSGSMDNTMKVWDVRSKQCIQTFMGHEKEVTCVRFSPDGRWVASSGKDGQFLVWDLVAGQLQLQCHTCVVYMCRVHVSCSACVMCHVSCVMCHVSCVMCHVSCVMQYMCHMSCRVWCGVAVCRQYIIY
jgi:katanin p80 WD40 repeat-containing subunit B1